MRVQDEVYTAIKNLGGNEELLTIIAQWGQLADNDDTQEALHTYNQKPVDSAAHYRNTNTGLYAIDRNPNEVDIDWIRENAFQI